MRAGAGLQTLHAHCSFSSQFCNRGLLTAPGSSKRKPQPSWCPLSGDPGTLETASGSQGGRNSPVRANQTPGSFPLHLIPQCLGHLLLLATPCSLSFSRLLLALHPDASSVQEFLDMTVFLRPQQQPRIQRSTPLPCTTTSR